MEDNCALVVVLRSSSIPPASVSWCQRQSRFWVSSELPGGGGDSLLVVFPCTWMHGSLWLEGSCSQCLSLVRVNVVLGCCSLPSSSFPVTASVASISAVRVLVIWFLPCGVSSFIVQGSYGLLEFPDTFELQEGGAEVAVCGDWCLGLRQALVRRFSPLWCGPIVVCCELRVLAGVFALCRWQGFVEGGAEVAVCGDWCLGLRQALVRRFSPLWCGPIVVCCELRVLAGVFALCWWQGFVVRSWFGGECLGKPILPARDSCFN
ncbi:hypothetical protein DY000_02062319 [Brassica cretica]|uniref:Uncharacterized protein n=1 Tax=Brassica cretica TaxID=69181 RepID=A0ABQ7B434_BRACR|nr:hypothetical protein DY000_02062319 [Brassica cretica]